MLGQVAARLQAEGPLPVVCENCSGSTTRWIALAALIVAVGSGILVALQFRMARKEHTEFIRTLRRRAKLGTPSVSLEGVWLFGKDRFATVAIGFRNTGSKAAEGVLINVVLPRICTDVQRANQSGKSISSGDPSTTPEELVDSEGASYTGHYLSWLEGNIWRTHHHVRWIRFKIPPGLERVPFKVSFSCDDFPEDDEGQPVSYVLKTDVVLPTDGTS